MIEVQKNHTVAKPMSQTEFNRLSEFIYGHCGIKMPPVKKIMLEARLQKRLRCLGMQSYAEYCNYLFKSPDREKEYAHMIDCVTTNKTDFFREPIHFQFLSQTVLPEFMQLNIEENLRPFLIWSAGCSSGEEPYTLAMVLSSFAARCQGFQFSILASDISTKVLEKARTAIYPEELVASVPFDMKQKYLLRGKDKSKRLIRIVPDLRDRIQFQRINLMDEHFLQPGSIDVIFCRNVIIYFDRLTQNKLLERLCSCLKNGGYLFLGHSETIHGFNLPLTRVSSTIYRKER